MSTSPLLEPLILASQSPRRRELLREAGYAFQVIAPDDHAEDPARDSESPDELVARLAHQKAANVAVRVERGVVLGADTVAECEGRILGKPADRADAQRMLRGLRGKNHFVHTGVCLWKRPEDRTLTRVAVTRLWMAPISEEQLQEYLDSGKWRGKAGAFGYQDRHGWLEIVQGGESNVVGLPLELLAEMLRALGRMVAEPPGDVSRRTAGPTD